MIIEYKAKSAEADQAYTKIKSQLKDISGKTSETANAFNGLGSAMRSAFNAIIGGGVVAFLTEIVNSIGDIKDEADKLGVSVESFQELTQASKEAGVSQDTLSMALFKTSKILGDAQRGNTAAADSLDNLGLSVKDFQGLSLDQSLLLIGDHLNMINDANLKNSVSMDLFGKSAKEMTRLFGPGFKQTMKDFSAFTVDQNTIDKLDQFGDKSSEVWKAIQGYAARSIVSTSELFAEKLSAMTDDYNNFANTIGDNSITATVHRRDTLSGSAGGTTGAYGQGILKGIGQSQTQVQKESLDAKILEKAANKLVTDSLTDLIPAVKQATKSFSDNNKAVNAITEALKNQGKVVSGQIIGAALNTDQYGNQMQAPDEVMINEFGALIKDAMDSGITTALDSYISNVNYGRMGPQVDTSGFSRSEQELKSFLADQKSLQDNLVKVATQPAKVDLKIEIQSAEGFIAKVVQSAAMSSEIANLIQQNDYNNARQFGSRGY